MTSKFPQVIESGGVVLTLTPDEAYVEFREDLPPEEVEAFIKEYELQLVEEEPGLMPRSSFNELFPDRRWLRLPEAHIEEFLERLLDDDRVRLASPVYHRADLLPKKTGITFSDFLLVTFQLQASDEQITDLIHELGTEDVSGEPELLGDNLRRLRILEPKRRHALEVAEQFAASSIVEDAEPDWAQLNSLLSATTPNDTYYAKQWNLAKIEAPKGWDLSTGSNKVVIAVIDTGCDLKHEDLSAKYVPVKDRRDVVSKTNTPQDKVGHGTCCAGIAAAASNNKKGVAGVTWGCQIMPISLYKAQYVSHIVESINWAQLHGAHVISISLNISPPHSKIDAAISAAHKAGIVLVAASGNDAPTVAANKISYPANHKLVMAVGASDKSDKRCVWSKKKASQFGPALDVVAPGISLWTTDITGTKEGYNKKGTSQGDAAGNYFNSFGGTSGATPHVAGLAGLLRSFYPKLTNDQIRSIIEKTAEKVGGYKYSHDPKHPSGTWNNEMGYGRINVFWALDFADVYIKDNPADKGSVPFVGNFYSNSDIFVRQSDDNILSYEPAKRGQKTNWIYVRVTNLGPAKARKVKVSVRAVPFAGTQFVYPHDWTVVDATHLKPTDLKPGFTLAPGATDVAKFTLDQKQVDQLYGWEKNKWHPCLLAEVKCENDYGTPAGVHTWQNNNLAQRNISTVGVGFGSSVSYPFVAGHELNMDVYMELVIDRHELPQEVELLLDPWDTETYFPALELASPKVRKVITFLDRTRLALSLCGCDGILSLEAGSSFECGMPVEGDVSLQGAELVTRQGKRLIAIREDQAMIGLQKRPGEMRQMSLTFRVPDEAEPEDRYQIDVSQRNTRQEVVGGVTLVVEVTG
jgi:subtilisin family serine protease